MPHVSMCTSTCPAAASGREPHELQAARRIKRAPVVDAENRSLGIVSRHDLVRVFTHWDDEINAEISADVFLHTLWIDPLTIGAWSRVRGRRAVQGTTHRRR
jgi:CBS domain-containing protein